MKSKKNILIVVLCVIVVALVGVTVWALFFRDNSTASNVSEVVKKPDSIAIPGYEKLVLKADQTEQDLTFSNPDQNACVFVITLSLEDGTVLWQSGEIKPGKTSLPVELNEPLSAGTYQGILSYACYTEDSSRTPLNGAETQVVLRVQ